MKDFNNITGSYGAASDENVFAGAVGAFLFALVGGVVWALLWQIGFLAGISGLIGVVCAIKGYKVFGKAETKRGIIISIIMAAIVIIIAWYACFAQDLYEVYGEWYEAGEVDYRPTYFECVGSAFYWFEDGEILRSYLFELIMGLVFCAIGSIGYIRGALRKVDNNAYNAAVNDAVHADFSVKDEDTSDNKSESSVQTRNNDNGGSDFQ